MNVMLIFNAIITAFGIYMAVSALLMKKRGKINPMILAKEEMKKVKDEKGFIDFIYWHEIIFGLLVVIVGIRGVLNEIIKFPSGISKIFEVVVFLAAFFWFQNSLMQARQRFLHQI